MLGFPPNHPLKNRMFHYFHHPFWGTTILGNPHVWTVKDDIAFHWDGFPLPHILRGYYVKLPGTIFKCLETKITAKKTTSPVNQGIFWGEPENGSLRKGIYCIYIYTYIYIYIDSDIMIFSWCIRCDSSGFIETPETSVSFFQNLSFWGVKTHQVDWHMLKGIFGTYCWWTKSCTTKDDYYPIIYRVLTIPGGAGFFPPTVHPCTTKHV